MTKQWYESKTIWVNLIALVALIIQTYNGFVVTPELQATALTVVNLILRTITKEELAKTVYKR